MLVTGRTGEEVAGGGPRVQIGDRAVTMRVVEVMDAAAIQPGAIVAEQQRPLLGELLEPASRSPFAAWRARMTLGRTEGEHEVVEVGTGEAVNLINASETGLWRTALARCSALDAALGAAVVRRVRGVVEFDGAHAVPVWVQDTESLRQLRSDLLADDLSEGARKTRVRAWLEAQPPAAAWVADDAGLRDAISGAPICEVVFVNLGDAPVAASAVLERGGVTPSGPEMVTVEPWHAARLHAAAATGQSDRERAVIVRAGGWSKRLPVLCKDLAAAPPGLQVGPLMLGLSNRSMKGASEAGVGVLPVAELPQGDRMTAGMLMRDVDRPGGREGTSGEKQRESWTVYFECMRPAASEVEEGIDRLHVWFGPSGPASKGLEVVVNRSGKDSAPGARVVRQQDRWLCWVPVPAAAIESDQHLRLGVTREVQMAGEARMSRTAWPRPLLPWETRPGRVCVDLSEWSKRGSAGPTEDGRDR